MLALTFRHCVLCSCTHLFHPQQPTHSNPCPSPLCPTLPSSPVSNASAPTPPSTPPIIPVCPRPPATCKHCILQPQHAVTKGAAPLPHGGGCLPAHFPHALGQLVVLQDTGVLPSGETAGEGRGGISGAAGNGQVTGNKHIIVRVIWQVWIIHTYSPPKSRSPTHRLSR